jgi:hypothetical protein
MVDPSRQLPPLPGMGWGASSQVPTFPPGLSQQQRIHSEPPARGLSFSSRHSPQLSADDFPPPEEAFKATTENLKTKQSNPVAKSQPPAPAQTGKPRPRGIFNKVKTEESAAESVPAAKPGRKAGARGYSEAEMVMLTKLARKYLPVGSKGWDALTETYRKECLKNSWPVREKKPLKTKFEHVSQGRFRCKH